MCVVGVFPDFEPGPSRVPVRSAVRLAKCSVPWSLASVFSRFAGVCIWPQQIQFHGCCSFSLILSISQFILNIASLLDLPITETLDGHVCTRNLDAACSVV